MNKKKALNKRLFLHTYLQKDYFDNVKFVQELSPATDIVRTSPLIDQVPVSTSAESVPAAYVNVIASSSVEYEAAASVIVQVLFAYIPSNIKHNASLDELPFFAAAIRWEVIDMVGRLIANPYYNFQVGQNGDLTWDGKRDNGKPARIGIYVMKVSFRDVSSTASWEKVKTVVLAKPL